MVPFAADLLPGTRRTMGRLGAVSASVLALSMLLAACSDEPTGTTPTAEAVPEANVAEVDVAETGVDPMTTAAVDLPEPAGSVDMAAVLAAGPQDEKALGPEDAPVTIVEYMSLTCPHCASFHTETFKQIRDTYIESGAVRFIIRDFPFDPRATAAAMLARCAPEPQYFPMIDVFFQQQSDWARAEDARSALLRLSRLAGFTQESFEACLTNQALLDELNAVRSTAAEDFGVRATPTFLIDGKRYEGALSVAQMSALIDGLLE